MIDALRANLTHCSVHSTAFKGLSLQTRKQHISLLQDFARLPSEFRHLTVAHAATKMLEDQRQTRSLSYVTVAQKVGAVAAAFNRLPQYTANRLAPVILNLDHEWKDACRAFRYLSALSTNVKKSAVTTEEILKAVRACEALGKMSLAIFFVLLWACAARPGEIVQLESSQVTLHPYEDRDRTAKLSILVTRGKTLKTVDPYTLHTVVPVEFADLLRIYMELRVHEKFLFSLSTSKSRSAFIREARVELRKVNAHHDMKAVRRGAAQTLAKAGVPLSTIMLFTRHQSVTTLRKYLGFGKAPSEEAKQAISAASELWPKRC